MFKKIFSDAMLLWKYLESENLHSINVWRYWKITAQGHFSLYNNCLIA